MPSTQKSHMRSRRARASLHLLEEAAERDDRQAFVRLTREMAWDIAQAEELLRTIHLALALDLAPLAMELAQRGKQLFPESHLIQQAAQVLRPPVVVSTRPAQGNHNEASRAWLAQHSHEHRGQWIAVRAGVLLGVAPTLKGLYQQIGSATDTPETIVVKVLP